MKYVAATKKMFHAYHTATAMKKTAAAIHIPTQKRLRRKTRRVEMEKTEERLAR